MATTKDVVERAIRCWNSHDREGWLACAGPDIVVDRTQRGPQAWGGLYDLWDRAFPDRRIEVVSIVEEGDRCAVEATLSGTHTGTLHLPSLPEGDLAPTGKQVSADYVAVQRVVDGKIARATHYWDRLDLLRQLAAAVTGV